MKKKSLLTIMIFILIVVSNAITYKLTTDNIETNRILHRAILDSYNLMMYDRNNTNFFDITFAGNFTGVFYNANHTNDIEKYKILCKTFNKEFFNILEKYQTKNKNKYGVSQSSEDLQLFKEVEDGTLKIKKLCNVSE